MLSRLISVPGSLSYSNFPRESWIHLVKHLDEADHDLDCSRPGHFLKSLVKSLVIDYQSTNYNFTHCVQLHNEGLYFWNCVRIESGPRALKDQRNPMLRSTRLRSIEYSSRYYKALSEGASDTNWILKAYGSLHFTSNFSQPTFQY